MEETAAAAPPPEDAVAASPPVEETALAMHHVQESPPAVVGTCAALAAPENEVPESSDQGEDDKAETETGESVEPESGGRGDLADDDLADDVGMSTVPGSETEALATKEQNATSPAPLPPGWTELVDPTSGQTYYLHESDGQSSWERPTAEASSAALTPDEPPKDELNDGSARETLQTEGAIDEFGLEGEESIEPVQSSLESDYAQDHGEKESVGASEQAVPDETDAGTLPPGWRELIDPSSGKPYYLNEEDNTTTWDKPVVTSPDADTKVEDEAPKDDEPNKETTNEPLQNDEEDSSVAVEPAVEVVPDTKEVEDAAGETESALPAGWVEMVDSASGKTYYYTEAENTSTWERPVNIPAGPTNAEEVPEKPPKETSLPDSKGGNELGSDFTMVEHSEAQPSEEPDAASTSETPKEDEADLPPGWVKIIDPASGTPYYINEAENITTWERPSNEVGSQKLEDEKAGVSQPEASSRVEDSALPPGWEEVVDPGSGKTYYVNEATNETTWDRPSVPSSGPSFAGTKERSRKEGPRPALCFATFGFGGRLCVWRSQSPTAIAMHRACDLMKTDPVVVAEQRKKESEIFGPLNSCEDGAVLEHIGSKATVESSNEGPSHDLLWSLVLIAAKSKGRLRSDDGVRNPRSPESGVISLLLDDTSGEAATSQPGIKDKNEGVGEIASTSSLKKVEDLLLWGKREEAVQEALFQ